MLPDASRHVNLLVLVYSLRILRLVEDRLVALVEDEAVETERVRVGNRREEVLEIVADVLEARDQHARDGDNGGPRRLVAEPHELGRIGYDRALERTAGDFNNLVAPLTTEVLRAYDQSAELRRVVLGFEQLPQQQRDNLGRFAHSDGVGDDTTLHVEAAV